MNASLSNPQSRGSTKRAPPKLPLSAFMHANSTAASSAVRREPLELVDTHIHLWTQRQYDNGHVTWPLRSDHTQLRRTHTLQDYADLTDKAIVNQHLRHSSTKFRGAVFVQAEAEHGDKDEDGSKGGWRSSLDEIDSVCQAALHSEARILAIAPWAPVHQGPQALEAYFQQAYVLSSFKQWSSKGGAGLTSCRFLLQDCPLGFMLEQKFINGLLWLGQHDVAFEMTLDVVQFPGVLDDAVEAISRLRQLEQQQQPQKQDTGSEHQIKQVVKHTRIVLDHFAKPNLVAEPTVPAPEHQTSYMRSLFELALLPHVSLKLSGLLDSADPQLVKDSFKEFRLKATSARSSHFATLRRRVLTYLEPALEAFGDSRIMVGSDWPMFRAKICELESDSSATGERDLDEEADAWAFEIELYRSALVELGCEGDALDRIFAFNAKEFYRIPT
ncbi:hypothetical protein OIO90_004809 [Microbotryomycetes sp. JL221]|nr:hypothetical protein OIO90_004809 [Microbotryomycetes sp. JL221]